MRCTLLVACSLCSVRGLSVSAMSTSVRLNDGNFIPRFGLGVYQVEPGQSTYSSVLCALKSGYRHIDTAGTSDEAAARITCNVLKLMISAWQLCIAMKQTSAGQLPTLESNDRRFS